MAFPIPSQKAAEELAERAYDFANHALPIPLDDLPVTIEPDKIVDTVYPFVEQLAKHNPLAVTVRKLRRKVLIIGGVTLAAGIVSVILAVKAAQKLEQHLEEVAREKVPEIQEKVTELDAKAFEASLNAYIQAVEEGKADPAPLQKLQNLQLPEAKK